MSLTNVVREDLLIQASKRNISYMTAVRHLHCACIWAESSQAIPTFHFLCVSMLVVEVH